MDIMMRIGTALSAAIALVGCVENDCGDGNDVDRGGAQIAMARAALARKLRDNASSPNVQWWWCETSAISRPPIGSGWTAITIDAPRGLTNGVGGWVTPSIQDAQHFGDSRDSWRAAALSRAFSVVDGSIHDLTCLSVEEMIDNLDRFVACQQPVEHGPATPGGVVEPTPLPPGSTGGDR